MDFASLWVSSSLPEGTPTQQNWQALGLLDRLMNELRATVARA